MTENSELGNAFGTSAAALANRLSRRSGGQAAATQAPARPEPAEQTPAAPAAPASEQTDQANQPDPPGEPEKQPSPAARRAKTSQRPTGRPAKKAPARTPAPAPAAAPVDMTAGSTVQVSVYLLPAALQAVRRQARETRRTNADIAFTAIDAVHEQLPELVAAHRTVPREEGSLFPSRVRHRATGDRQRRILWSMQATPAELEVVDRLVAETGAASRSELIAVAIEAHLL